MKAYSDGLRIAKNSSILLYERGILQANIHQFQEAENDFLSASQELLTAPKNDYPKLMSVQLALAAIYNYRGNYSGALPYFQNALDLVANGSNTKGLIMQFAHPERIKALYELGFYKELEVFHKILRRFLNACIHCDFTTLDELTA